VARAAGAFSYVSIMDAAWGDLTARVRFVSSQKDECGLQRAICRYPRVEGDASLSTLGDSEYGTALEDHCFLLRRAPPVRDAAAMGLTFRQGEARSKAIAVPGGKPLVFWAERPPTPQPLSTKVSASVEEKPSATETATATPSSNRTLRGARRQLPNRRRL